MVARLVAIALAAALAACSRPADDASVVDPVSVGLARLREFETSKRTATDFRAQGGADDTFGSDPTEIVALPDGQRAVGVLRGAAAVVLLDRDGQELARAAAPRSAASVAVDSNGTVFVTGDLATEIARYDVHGETFARRGSWSLGDVRAVRALAVGPEGVLYVVEERDHRLLTLDGDGTVLDGAAPPIGLGPIAVRRTRDWVVVNCVLSHEVIALPVDARGVPRRADAVRIRQDGPFWAVDAIQSGDVLWLAMGGVEDHPLDRRQGSFGYIDSFAYVYRVAGSPPAARRLASVDLSALDVVTPKLVRLAIDGTSVTLRASGYGSATSVTLRWSDPQPNRKGVWSRPEVVSRTSVPGVVAEASLEGGARLAADPLLDAWIVVDSGGDPRVVPVTASAGAPPADVEAHLGEALFFTTLMAPWNRTRGSLSRFTCETCHFEGYVDGRIHDTGREDTHVTTRPLHGLFNDPPYFSRALDPDLTAMVHNEFRVAGRRSRHDPWFTLDPSRAPWLASLGVGTTPLEPERLRRALMTFVMRFTHRPNPSAAGRVAWSPDERHGAELFREHCETCHEARLVANRPESRVPFAEWEALVLSPEGPILWARDTYEKTGIVPYVHPSGARVPSLRRLYKKRPYFTNGSSPDLDDVLRRTRATADGFSHAGSDGSPPLDATSRASLHAFLDLL